MQTLYMCTLYSKYPFCLTKQWHENANGIRRGIRVPSMLLIISSQVNYKDGTIPGGFQNTANKFYNVKNG